MSVKITIEGEPNAVALALRKLAIDTATINIGEVTVDMPTGKLADLGGLDLEEISRRAQQASNGSAKIDTPQKSADPKSDDTTAPEDDPQIICEVLSVYAENPKATQDAVLAELPEGRELKKSQLRTVISLSVARGYLQSGGRRGPNTVTSDGVMFYKKTMGEDLEVSSDAPDTPPKDGDGKEGEKIEFDVLKLLLTDVVEKFGTDRGREILGGFNIKKLSEIKPAKYADLRTALTEALEEEDLTG